MGRYILYAAGVKCNFRMGLVSCNVKGFFFTSGGKRRIHFYKIDLFYHLFHKLCKGKAKLNFLMRSIWGINM